MTFSPPPGFKPPREAAAGGPADAVGVTGSPSWPRWSGAVCREDCYWLLLWLHSCVVLSVYGFPFFSSGGSVIPWLSSAGCSDSVGVVLGFLTV